MAKLPQYHPFKPFFQTFWLLLLTLLAWLLTRLCLYFFNPSLFGNFAHGEFSGIFFGGLRFDLSSMVVFNALFIAINVIPWPFREHKSFRLARLLTYVIPNILGLLLNLADTAYLPFSGKRMTGDILNFMKAGGNDLLHLIPQYLLDFWYAAILLIALSVLMVRLFVLLNPKLEGRVTMGYALKQLISFLVFVLLSVFAIRGGFQLKPINIITAGQYAAPSNISLVLNTPFTVMKTLGNRELKVVSYFPSEDALNDVFDPVQKMKAMPLEDSLPKGNMNVVMLILESFSTEHIRSLQFQPKVPGSKSFTPFLDSLAGKSLAYQAFANGKRSIEGIPAVLASLPTLMNNDFITSSFAGNKINSLASILKAKGYTSAFYHGGNNGTMNFNDFAKMAGFDQYYGRNEYNNEADYDGKWGIYDEPFLQYFASNLKKTKQPFCAALFTLSSHHPYNIPEAYEDKFPKGNLRIEESIAYTDYALKRFFETASKQPWFKNTLFVLTADHTSEANETFYKTRMGMYSVPVIFYQAGVNLKGKSAGPVQQTDIMPSVLQYLHYNSAFTAFGNSVFDKSAPAFAVSYLNNSYLFLQGDYALVFDGVITKEIYNVKKDPLQTKNLIDSKPAVLPAMETYLKAIIQQYNNRMVENRLLP